MSFTGGKLKLKGGLGVKSGATKKKSKRQKAKKVVQVDVDDEDPKVEHEEEGLGGDDLVPDDAPKETPEGYHLPPRSEGEDRRTQAERKYDEWLKRREETQVKVLAKKSHRARIREFNEYLANLTEHHDIPKVGPG